MKRRCLIIRKRLATERRVSVRRSRTNREQNFTRRVSPDEGYRLHGTHCSGINDSWQRYDTVVADRSPDVVPLKHEHHCLRDGA